MTKSTYDACLLYKNSLSTLCSKFEIVSMQIDDILILINKSFADKKEKKLKASSFMHKDRDRLKSEHSIKFNDTIIDLESNESITLKQDIRSVENISLIQRSDAIFISTRGMLRNNLSSKDQYVTQRAREIYLAFICQLEASFDLSHAIQSIEFSKKDIVTLNKRLK